ncbi:hypothetical protein ANRL1_01385 [Anaerolineae bacterium]|nr:hypothetical protein ANRL1_01385 [Anaerolineae bacterium]
MERERACKQTEHRDTITHALLFVIAAAVVLFIGIAGFSGDESDDVWYAAIASGSRKD